MICPTSTVWASRRLTLTEFQNITDKHKAAHEAITGFVFAHFVTYSHPASLAVSQVYQTELKLSLNCLNCSQPQSRISGNVI